MSEKLFEGIDIAEDAKKTITERVLQEKKQIESDAIKNSLRREDDIANRIQDKTGIQRLSGETKYTDYLERASFEYFEKQSQKAAGLITEKEAEIKELKSKLTGGITDEKTKEEILKLQKLIAEKTTESETWSKKFTETEKEYQKRIHEIKIDAAIGYILPAFDSDIKDTEYIRFRTEKAIAEMQKEGKVDFDENGKLIATDDNYRIKLASEILSEKLKDLAPKEKQVTITAGQKSGVPINTPLNTKGMTEPERDAIVVSYIKAQHPDVGYTSDEFAKLYIHYRNESLK